MSQSLTVDAVCNAQHAAVQAGSFRPTFVQVRLKGTVHCAELVRSARGRDGGDDFFSVSGKTFDGWLPGSCVRLCSHIDGRCTCSLEASEAAERLVAAKEEAARADGAPLGATAALAACPPLVKRGEQGEPEGESS